MKKQFRYKLIISYDGTHYNGWQIQPNGTTVQENLEKAIYTILKEKVVVIGSGRTDSGVHAKAQVAHFDSTHELDINKFLYSINSLLPYDIRVHGLKKVPNTFHARYSSKRKTYRYNLYLNKTQDPFQRLYSHHIRRPLDLDLMEKALKLFVGKKDFKSFANEAEKGSAGKNSVREIYNATLHQDLPFAYVELTGDGFLYKMVRNIMGTLLEIGMHKYPIERIKEIFRAQDRRYGGSCAPAKGLFLQSVEYGSDDE